MLIPAHISYLRAVGKALRTFNLKPAKQIQFKFDPFSENVKSIRDFFYFISAEKYRQTNPKCSYKTDVCNDRSEPVVKVSLVNKQEIIFKTSNLSSVELLQLFNKHVSDLEKGKEETENKETAEPAKKSKKNKKK